jgi:hypothetical protein
MEDEKQSSQVLQGLLFPKIFQAFRIARQLSNLTIALLAVGIICLAGWLMDLTAICLDRWLTDFDLAVVVSKDTQGQITETELDTYVENATQVPAYIEKQRDTGDRAGVFCTIWHFTRGKFHRALYSLFAPNISDVLANIADCFKAIIWAFRYHFVYCAVFFIMKFIVICLAGGAICRIAALQFARGERPGLFEALRFSKKQFLNFFFAPMFPLLVMIGLSVCILALGLIVAIPYAGELILVFPVLIPVPVLLALAAGSIIAFFAIGLVAGFGLMFPAVAYDNSHWLDASMNRSVHYVYSKPWHMGFYTGVAAVYGAICYIFLRLFAFLLLWVTQQSFYLGAKSISRLLAWLNVETRVLDKVAAIWPEPGFMNLLGTAHPEPATWSQSVAAFLVYLVSLIVIGLLISFIMSFYFSASTIIYSLVRKKADNTPLEEIYTHFEDDQSESRAVESESERPPVDPKSQTDSSSAE